MSLYTIGTIDHEDRIIHHGQGLLHLGGKIHMSWRIEEGHRDILKLKARHLRKDGDAAFLLHLVCIEVGITFIDTPRLLDASGAVEDLLREGRLSCIYMRKDAQHQAFRILICHLVFSCSSCVAGFTSAASVHPYTVL